MKNDLDRRAQKTRQAIQDALLSLMQEKQFNRITIQDIIDRANVGRSTFYSHYATKEELLMSSVEQMFEMLNLYLMHHVDNNKDNVRIIPVAELFEHIKENSRVLKGLMKAEGADYFFDKAQTYWNNRIEEHLWSKVPEQKEPKVPRIILTNHISSTLISLLKWWVNSKMIYTPLQMDQYFQELINPCLELTGN